MTGALDHPAIIRSSGPRYSNNAEVAVVVYVARAGSRSRTNLGQTSLSPAIEKSKRKINVGLDLGLVKR